MDENRNSNGVRSNLPFHKLIAYDVARDLVVAVAAAKIRDRSLRDQALRAAQSAMLKLRGGRGARFAHGQGAPVRRRAR